MCVNLFDKTANSGTARLIPLTVQAKSDVCRKMYAAVVPWWSGALGRALNRKRMKDERENKAVPRGT